MELSPTQWIVGLAAIIFDIDVGQRVEHLFPGDALSEEEKQAVAFHSFPDSMSMELHAKTSVRDTCFWFRVRRSTAVAAGATDGSAAAASRTSSNTSGGAAGPAVDTFLYGYVFCRQRQDEALPRGGEQLSVVVLSEHPFSGVLRPLSQVAGPLYFSQGPAALHQVYQEVCAWPAPTAAGLLQLQVSFNTLSGRLPPFDTLPHPSCCTAVDVGMTNPLPRNSSLARSSGSLNLAGSASLQSATSFLPSQSQMQQTAAESGGMTGAPGVTAAADAVTAPLARSSWSLLYSASSPLGSKQASGNIGHMLLATEASGSSLFPLGLGAGAYNGRLSGELIPVPGHRAGAASEPNLGVRNNKSEQQLQLLLPQDSSHLHAAATAPPATLQTSNSHGLVAGQAIGVLPPTPPGVGHVQLRPRHSVSARQALAGAGLDNTITLHPSLSVQRMNGSGTGGVLGPGSLDSVTAMQKQRSMHQLRHSLSRSSLQSYDSNTQGPLAPVSSDETPAQSQQVFGRMSAPPSSVQGTTGASASASAVPAGGAAPVSANNRQQHVSFGQDGGGTGPAGSIEAVAAGSGSNARQPSGSTGLSNTASLPGSSNNLNLPRRLSTGVQADSVGGAFCDADIYTPLQPHLQRLWQLWELVLLARPLLVVGPSPADCSGAVAALISLVAPMPYAPDFRPYYTIHDSSFSKLASGALPGPQQRSVPCIMGITNLYFVKALTHWPNVLSVGRKEQASSWAADAPPPFMVSSMFNAAGAVKALRQRSQGAQSLLGGHTEALWSSYKPLTRPDSTLLARLLQTKPGDARSKLSRIAAVNSDALRKHFQELTSAFLAPFARYFEPGSNGLLPAWDESEFLFTVRSPTTPHPAILMERVGGVVGSLVELYGRFIASTNFRDWFMLHRRRLQHLEAPVLPPHLRGLVQPQQPATQQQGSKALAWFRDASKHMDEVQLINLFFALEGQLRDVLGEVDAAASCGDDAAMQDALDSKTRLQRELVTLFLAIGQQDLQLLCVSAPSRRDLLLQAAQQVLAADQLQQLRQICSLLE